MLYGSSEDMKTRVIAPVDQLNDFEEILCWALPSLRPAHNLHSMIDEDLPYHLPYTVGWHH